MLGIYFSGTGNTRHCVERLVHLLDKEAELVPLESEAAEKGLGQHDLIVLGYPIQYSNIPVMVRDFITNQSASWKGKQVFCLATMGLFSGDGAGCAARLLKGYGAEVLGGLHLKMPDSICDVKLLKRSPEKNGVLIKAAEDKIDHWAEKIKAGEWPKEGLQIYHRLAGLLGQRLWFSGKTKSYSDKLTVSEACVGCGLCVRLCPMRNLSIQGQKAVAGGRCTMCYRCLNSCPKKAITLLGKNVVVQYSYDTALKNGR